MKEATGKTGFLSFASLFSGCGGFDLGFIEAGFRCVTAMDSDPAAVEVYNRNIGAHAIECDLTQNPRLDLMKGVDVLLAGPPCQGFSTAGKRELNDPRNELLLVAGRIAAALRPRVAVIENVAGVKSGAHRRYWEGLREHLRNAGFRTTEVTCIGTSMGVSQIRRRNVMIAWRTGCEFQVRLQAQPGGVLSSALTGVASAPNHEVRFLSPGSKLAKIAAKIKQGQKLSNVRGGPAAVHTWEIPEVFGRTNARERAVLEYLLKSRRRLRMRDHGDADPVPRKVLINHFGSTVDRVLDALIEKGYLRRIRTKFDLVNGFNGKFRRLNWDSPSLTVDTRFGDPRYFLHPDEERGFTVREAARIQGFPDNFIFSGPLPVQYRLIGNAVPPPMANIIAQFVQEAILK